MRVVLDICWIVNSIHHNISVVILMFQYCIYSLFHLFDTDPKPIYVKIEISTLEDLHYYVESHF